jgi:pyruvate-ferredoxin/flavodoxin oxidoreductase
MPASSALFRDMTAIRFQHPSGSRELHRLRQVLHRLPRHRHPRPGERGRRGARHRVKRARKHGHELEHLPKAVRAVEKHLKALLAAAQETRLGRRDGAGRDRQDAAESPLAGGEGLARARDLPRGARRVPLRADAAVLHAAREAAARAAAACCRSPSNPYTCKGCMECVEVCDDDALRPMTQTRSRSPSCAGSGTSGSTCRRRRSATPHRRPRAGDRRARDAAARQGQLPRLHERRRRLPGLLREDRSSTCSPPRSRR